MEKEKEKEKENANVANADTEKQKIVRLNVGGIKYTTTNTTLCRFEGFLRSLCYYDSLKDGKGRIFIDRNGVIFEYILDFLRSGEMYCPTEIIPRLLIEAEFYQITELIKILSGKPKEDLGVENRIVSLNIGGVVYTLTLSTMMKAVVMQNGYLRKIAEYITHKTCEKDWIEDDDGTIFIDRDPKLFAPILEYLRTSNLPVLGNYNMQKNIAEEALFYLGSNNLLTNGYNAFHPSMGSVLTATGSGLGLGTLNYSSSNNTSGINGMSVISNTTGFH